MQLAAGHFPGQAGKDGQLMLKTTDCKFRVTPPPPTKERDLGCDFVVLRCLVLVVEQTSISTTTRHHNIATQVEEWGFPRCTETQITWSVSSGCLSRFCFAAVVM